MEIKEAIRYMLISHSSIGIFFESHLIPSTIKFFKGNLGDHPYFQNYISLSSWFKGAVLHVKPDP